jgi:quinone-modifying oxidoreductase subunit QmoA
MVVLATGMVPQTKGLPIRLRRDDFGFLEASESANGLFAAGCARHPADVSTSVQDATGMALRALQCAKRSECHG